MRPSRSTSTALAIMAAGLATGVAIAGSHAATIAALQDGTSIAWIDTDKMKVTKLGAARRRRQARRHRCAAGRRQALRRHGRWRHRHRRRQDRQVGEEEPAREKLPAGVTFSVDFNPAADRLRVLTSAGMSLRINVDDGKTTVDGQLKYADTDANKGKTAARDSCGVLQQLRRHQGNRRSTTSTPPTASSCKQAPPNDGILNTVGKLNVTLAGPSHSMCGRTARAATPAGCWQASSTASTSLRAPPSRWAGSPASRARSATSPSCRPCEPAI